jgi:hypothetical protein
MTSTHDIFLRAYAVTATKRKKHKPKSRSGNNSKWPSHALIFDTETRITADQSLTFGVYHLCDLTKDGYALVEEGLFYADDLPKKDRRLLETYMRTAVPDVPRFPPLFPLYSRSDFIKRVFWPAIRFNGALVVGFNLPFDLARLALKWSRGKKNEWSLTMSQFPDGTENFKRPRILIQPIDSKKAFIQLATPWKFKEWSNNGDARFLDLRTLLWALYNRSFSLKSACEDEAFKPYHLPQKQDGGAMGKVTRKEIGYARQDVRCTVALLNALRQEYDKHPIDLMPHKAYSPASVAKAYLERMGIKKPESKFTVPNKIFGIAMQSYYGGRAETRIRCAEVPVVPVDFTSQYPSCCALMGLFEVLTARSVCFVDDTKNIRSFLKQITLDKCFHPTIWKDCKFFALVKPEDDIFPVRTVYNEVTQNIGNNYLTSGIPIWFAGPDLIASAIRTGNAPQVMQAIRMIPSSKQTGMRSVNLRGMVQINPYKDDLFRKTIEQRKLHKSDEALAYWLKIFANSIYGFFVELNPETRSQNIPIDIFSGNTELHESSPVIEKQGAWFFPPLASLITSAGRLLLAMTEACVKHKRGSYLFCDTDSLAIVASKQGGALRVPGSKGRRILSWAEVQAIVDRFASLNPYDREVVKGSILNLVDANFMNSKPQNPRRQLYGYSIAAKRYCLYERVGAKDIRIVDPKAHGIGFLYPPKDSPKGWERDHDAPAWIYEMWDYVVRGALRLKRKKPSWLNMPQMMRLTITTYNVLGMLGEWEVARPYNFILLPMVDPTFGHAFYKRTNEKVLLVAAFSSKQERWFGMKCENIHSGKKYKMVDCTKIENPPHNVVFPSQFARLLIEYQEHPEAKSLAPDGTPCESDTTGLLQRAHIVAGEFRYIGKEADRKWEEGDDISVLEFKTTEYGRAKKVVADIAIADKIRAIGIRKTLKLTKMSQHTIEKLLRGEPVKRKTHEHVLKAIQDYERPR